MSTNAQVIVNAIDNPDFSDDEIAEIAVATMEVAAKRGRTVWEAIAKKIEDSSESMEIGASLDTVVLKYLYPDDE